MRATLSMPQLQLLLQCTAVSLLLFLVPACSTPRPLGSPLPQLVDRQHRYQNLTGTEIAIDGYGIPNWQTLEHLLSRRSESDQQELQRRMTDQSVRWELRLLYASVLAAQGNPTGQSFLVAQAQTTPPEKLPNVFSAIHTTWSLPLKMDGRTDMGWAAATMLAALTDARLTKPEYPGRPEFIQAETVRSLAVRHGHFEQILAKQRNNEAIPVLADFVFNEITREPGKDFGFPPSPMIEGPEVDSVVSALGEFDAPQVEDTMLFVAQLALQLEGASTALREPFRWLVEHRKKSATVIIRNELWREDVYFPLSHLNPPFRPFVEAVRATLPKLQDGNRQGCDLYRQHSARANAEILLILAENPDPVPALMAFAANEQKEQRDHAILQLKVRKDPRAVTWAKDLALSESEWFLPFRLISLLEETPGDAATSALLELSKAPFDKVEIPTDIHYSADDYRKAASEALVNRSAAKAR